MKKLYYIIYIGIFMLLLAGCQDEGMFTPSEEKGIVTYSIRMDDGLQSRSIGDETIVNNLSILVFDKNEKTLVLRKDTLNWNNLKPEDLQFSLLKGEYQVLFWLQYADNNVNTYTIDENGKVSVAYNKNWAGRIEDMKKWDAFYYVDTLEINNDAQTKPIILTRPLGQLNWADSQLVPSTDEHSVVITLSGIATSFDPFLTEESEVQPLTEKDEITFTFTAFTDEPLNTNDSNYYYLSCNYLFPTNLTATFELQDKEGNSLKKVGIEEPLTIEIVSNTRTNVLGSIVLKPEAPETNGAWDGKTLTMPELEDNCYIIDDPSDLAWLGSDENTLEKACTLKVVKNIDMNCTEETENSLTSLALPAGSIFMGVADENNVSPCISNIKLTTGGLFGDATNITVQNLTLDKVTATSEGHVGVLVNTLTGSSTFTNVSIRNSSATTAKGAAGGMIGYITNKKDERLNVTISACTLTDNIVDGSLTSGVYVGRFRGYDNNETLTFSSCNESSATINGTKPYYVEGNEATWLANNDYSNYSGWLGNEEFYRGTVMYGSNRFIPCWDGKTKITPLTDGTTKLIYSAFDLANLQGTAAGNIKLMENVDMEHDLDGASKDGVRNHIFKALSTLTKLDGNGKTIYNITIRDNYYGGFVKSESCVTTFENVTFDGADIRVTHDTSSGNGYVGTLRGFAWATTTINNVKVKNGYLYGVNKMGGLCGGVFSTLTCAKSSVENYYIENYNSNIKDGGFFAHGECGGLIGMITSATAKISDCSVYQTTMHCMGQNDIWVILTTIPGRHVNDFIGDIRLDGGQRVDLINNTVSNNKFTNRKKDTHSSKCPIVGKCYKISGTAGTVYIGSTKVF